MAAVPEQIPVADGRPNDREPNLMRFGLRQMFGLFSLLTLLVALLAQVGGVWPIVIVSAALLVAAHIFGTFLGTRLRDTSHEVQRWKARPGSLDPDRPVRSEGPFVAADIELPIVALASHEQLGRWPMLPLALGTLAGAFLGALGIYVAGDDVSWPGLSMGAVSCGVIGAWTALLSANFYAMTRNILRQASRELDRDQSGR